MHIPFTTSFLRNTQPNPSSMACTLLFTGLLLLILKVCSSGTQTNTDACFKQVSQVSSSCSSNTNCSNCYVSGFPKLLSNTKLARVGTGWPLRHAMLQVMDTCGGNTLPFQSSELLSNSKLARVGTCWPLCHAMLQALDTCGGCPLPFQSRDALPGVSPFLDHYLSNKGMSSLRSCVATEPIDLTSKLNDKKADYTANKNERTAASDVRELQHQLHPRTLHLAKHHYHHWDEGNSQMLSRTAACIAKKNKKIKPGFCSRNLTLRLQPTSPSSLSALFLRSP